MDKMEIGDFSKQQAISYLDYCSLQGISNTTYNNRYIHMRALFTELEKREYILKNPFSKLGRKKQMETVKDTLTNEEMKLISTRAKQVNIYLYFALQFAFYSLIRQEELARLKFKHIDLKIGKIFLHGDITKNGAYEILDIPSFFVEELKEAGFHLQPKNTLVFGKGIKPNADKLMTQSELYKAHRKILLELEANKKDFVIRKGVTFASWRKSGFNYWADVLTEREQDNFFRHKDKSIKQVYLKKKNKIERVRNCEKLF